MSKIKGDGGIAFTRFFTMPNLERWFGGLGIYRLAPVIMAPYCVRHRNGGQWPLVLQIIWMPFVETDQRQKRGIGDETGQMGGKGPLYSVVPFVLRGHPIANKMRLIIVQTRRNRHILHVWPIYGRVQYCLRVGASLMVSIFKALGWKKRPRKFVDDSWHVPDDLGILVFMHCTTVTILACPVHPNDFYHVVVGPFGGGGV
jgi:hypothetical protein